MPMMKSSRMRPLCFPAASLLVPFLALSAAEDTQLPDLTVPMGGNTTFGTDLRAKDPVLGITVIDPLGRLPG
jgi:hypothetical protein